MIKVGILIYLDCSIAVDFPDKVLFFEFSDSEETCETALCIAAILEFTGMYTVKINAFPDDELGNAYVEYYEELKEKGQLIKPLSTAKKND